MVTDNPLFISPRMPEVRFEPFCYFEVDNFLPQDLYEEALSQFPQREWFPEQTEGNKLRLSSARSSELFGDLMATRPVWRRVIDWMKADAFIQDIYTVAREGLVNSRGIWGARQWTLQPRSGIQSLSSVQVRADFEFSRLEAGAFVPPHTDGPTKLVSALLYFPDPTWKPEFGGDTVYYRSREGRSTDNWRNSRLRQEDLVPFHTNSFAPNRLAVFLKSAHSHHAVDTIKCPPAMSRNSLNYNIHAILSPMELRFMRRKMDALAALSKFRGRRK